MRTAIVSDLHLGAQSGADHVVLLGDTLELRELPLARGLEFGRPLFEALGEVTAGRRVTIVPGNHDHHLAEPWLTQLAVDGAELGAANEWEVPPGHGAAGELARLMPSTSVYVAYPGLFLRPDVYATHGHYLDMHLTIPRPEGVAAGLMGRMTGTGRDCRSAADYERVLSPMYAFYSRLAEGAASRSMRKGSSLSRVIWGRLNGDGGAVGRFMLGRVAIPGGVALLNGLGLGPLGKEVSGEELRRSGLRAMARVVEGLGVEAEHVLFGHTHRPGPLEDDDPAEWRTPGGTRLWNTGSWLYEDAFTEPGGGLGPYSPGTLIWLEDSDPVVKNVIPEPIAG